MGTDAGKDQLTKNGFNMSGGQFGNVNSTPGGFGNTFGTPMGTQNTSPAATWANYNGPLTAGTSYTPKPTSNFSDYVGYTGGNPDKSLNYNYQPQNGGIAAATGNQNSGGNSTAQQYYAGSTTGPGPSNPTSTPAALVAGGSGGGGGNSTVTNTGTTNFAPTGAQVSADPNKYKGTSFDPSRAVIPLNMQPGNPLNPNTPTPTPEFNSHPAQGAPLGPPPGSLPTANPNIWITGGGSTWLTPGYHPSPQEYTAAFGDVDKAGNTSPFFSDTTRLFAGGGSATGQQIQDRYNSYNIDPTTGMWKFGAPPPATTTTNNTQNTTTQNTIPNNPKHAWINGVDQMIDSQGNPIGQDVNGNKLAGTYDASGRWHPQQSTGGTTDGPGFRTAGGSTLADANKTLSPDFSNSNQNQTQGPPPNQNNPVQILTSMMSDPNTNPMVKTMLQALLPLLQSQGGGTGQLNTGGLRGLTPGASQALTTGGQQPTPDPAVTTPPPFQYTDSYYRVPGQ